jgi:hypothetical protein
VEDHWAQREFDFGLRFLINGSLPSAPAKCDPFWILGVQRNRITPDVELLRDLPARLGGRLAKRAATADLSSQSLFSLDTP